MYMYMYLTVGYIACTDVSLSYRPIVNPLNEANLEGQYSAFGKPVSNLVFWLCTFQLPQCNHLRLVKSSIQSSVELFTSYFLNGAHHTWWACSYLAVSSPHAALSATQWSPSPLTLVWLAGYLTATPSTPSSETTGRRRRSCWTLNTD